jgi:hypothetical protein
MPRFFFHLHNDIHAEDSDGVELPDVAAMRDYATANARELVCASVRRGHLNLGHYLRVTDEDGQEVLKLRFGESLTITS